VDGRVSRAAIYLAFFDWLICKILSSDWSIECFEAFVASSGPQHIYYLRLDLAYEEERVFILFDNTIIICNQVHNFISREKCDKA